MVMEDMEEAADMEAEQGMEMVEVVMGAMKADTGVDTVVDMEAAMEEEVMYMVEQVADMVEEEVDMVVGDMVVEEADMDVLRFQRRNVKKFLKRFRGNTVRRSLNHLVRVNRSR